MKPIAKWMNKVFTFYFECPKRLNFNHWLIEFNFFGAFTYLLNVISKYFVVKLFHSVEMLIAWKKWYTSYVINVMINQNKKKKMRKKTR